MKNIFKLSPLLLILIFDAMGFGLVIPLLHGLILDPATSLLATDTSHAVRALTLGLTLALFPLAVMVATPLLGAWSDKIGRKPVLLICLCGGFLGLIACTISIGLRSIGLLLVGRFLTGFTSASQPIAQAAVIDMSSPQQKPVNLGIVAFAMTLGMVLGPLLGGFLSDDHLKQGLTFATPFWVASILSLISLIVLWRSFQETAVVIHRHRSWRQQYQQSIQLFYSAPIRRLLACFICLELAWSLYFQAMPLLFSQHFAYTSQQLALFITFLGGTMSFGLVVIFRVLVRVFPLIKIIRYSFIIGALTLFSLLFTHTAGWQWLGAVPFTLSVGIAYTALISALSSAVTTPVQGWLMGLASALLALSWAISGLLTGILISQGMPVVLGIIILLFSGGWLISNACKLSCFKV